MRPDQTDVTITDAKTVAFFLTAAPSVVRKGRDRVRDTLRDWGLGLNDQLVSAALLITSEMLTNGVRHAGGQLTVRLDLDVDRLILEVHDNSPKLPRARKAAPDFCAEDGRGLTLIDAYSNAHGAERTVAGKRCWAVLTLPPEALRERDRTAGYADAVRWVVEPAGAALLATSLAEICQELPDRDLSGGSCRTGPWPEGGLSA